MLSARSCRDTLAIIQPRPLIVRSFCIGTVLAEMTLLAETLERVHSRDGSFHCVPGVRTGDGWVGVAEIVAEPRLLDDWLADLAAGEAKGRRDVAGSYLASWLAAAAVKPVAAATHLVRRAWPTSPENLAVHRRHDWWFDGLAVFGNAVFVLSDDPDADNPAATVVADMNRMRERIARELGDLLSPVFRAIRTHAGYGVAGMWGGVADGIAADLLWRARDDGRDGESAWREANLLIDALAARIPLLKSRPTLARVERPEGRAHFAVRGTCCLYYKVSGHEPSPLGEAYCTSCPFREDSDRQRRWAAWLTEHPASTDVSSAAPAASSPASPSAKAVSRRST